MLLSLKSLQSLQCLWSLSSSWHYDAYGLFIPYGPFYPCCRYFPYSLNGFHSPYGPNKLCSLFGPYSPYGFYGSCYLQSLQSVKSFISKYLELCLIKIYTTMTSTFVNLIKLFSFLHVRINGYLPWFMFKIS